jgi:hypothetical protein
MWRNSSTKADLLKVFQNFFLTLSLIPKSWPYSALTLIFRAGESEEYIPLREYLLRHDKVRHVSFQEEKEINKSIVES